MVVNKWYPSMKENVILFTKNFGVSLNYYLYRFNLKNEPSCICEFECENCYYFFMECPLYDNIRRIYM